jgi:type IV pilus assembly protein PilN
MTHINLLPWREQLKKERQKEFLALMLLSIGVTLFICLMIHLVLARQYAMQMAANNFLNQEITSVDAQIVQVNAIKQKKNDLIRRLYIIQRLQTDRAQLVQMFDDFVKILPPGIYITSVKKEANTITVSGRAQSNQQVSALMKNIDASSSFENAILTEIQNNDDDQQNKVLNQLYTLGFELQMQPELLKEQIPVANSTATPQPAGSPAPTPGAAK